MGTRLRLLIAVVIGGLMLGSTSAHSQNAPGVTAEERAAARREGQVTYYTARTTIAANTLELIDEPLDRKWLQRARRSDCAEPLHEPVYKKARLSPERWEKLQNHLQFR